MKKSIYVVFAASLISSEKERDMIPELKNPCTGCCLTCNKYISINEQHRLCESRKERDRKIRKMVADSAKKK